MGTGELRRQIGRTQKHALDFYSRERYSAEMEAILARIMAAPAPAR
jgi:hypothetical protein